jgi:hypothetical protein
MPQMAQLISPGIDVQIIDESFYGASGPGTVPLIVFATAANKPSPSGSGIAAYTAPSMAGRLFLATSQRELIQNFGNPKFQSSGGTQLHGHELNEYGLHAAYSFLGISNRAYVVRADIDLNALEPSDGEPHGMPVAGTYWLDTDATLWGVFQSNGGANPGSAWSAQTVRVTTTSDIDGEDLVPLSSFGNEGDFAVVPQTNANLMFEKVSGGWYQIGSAGWKAAHPTIVRGSTSPGAVVSGNVFSINGRNVTLISNSLADVATAINAANIPSVTASITNNALTIRNTAGGDLVLAQSSGSPLTALGIAVGTVKGVSTVFTNDASYPANSVAGDVWVKGSAPNRGAMWRVRYYTGSGWNLMSAPFHPFVSTLNDGDALKDAAARTAMGVPATGTIYVGYDASTGAQQLRRWSGSRWEALSYEASATAPTTEPEDGALWYSTKLRADIMVSNGGKWIGYRRGFPDTDPYGPIISASMPVAQSDGTELVENDLWINTSDLDRYPNLHRYDSVARRWRLVDMTDQTTPFGIIFADARANSGTTFVGIANAGSYAFEAEMSDDMTLSDFADPDAPDARLYPDGMMLFNTRYSTFNVKVWRPMHFALGGFDENVDFTTESYTVGNPAYEFPKLDMAGRWVTISGNRQDGAAWMGRKAQRAMVVRAMSAAIQNNEDLRSELVDFNLIAAPGYPEMLDEMITLNIDQKEVSFIVGDTPARLPPSATEVRAWGRNLNGAASNGDEGLTSANVYAGIYYPWGLGTNIDGSEIMIPPSTIALRTIAYNDQVSYPWFAPAGYRRGLVTNATTVGYLNKEGEFAPVLLNESQRNTLYENRINPIAFIPGRGLVVYGQKTLSPLSSALDRVNVARLANYLKVQLDLLMRPFLFEQNDADTREAARITTERFLSGMIGLRAVEDYAVLCDESNNTSERRDRNELWVDVLVAPLKSVEFIYVPVRIRNSGTINNA